jgi:alkylhydroperoxidase family enzyme
MTMAKLTYLNREDLGEGDQDLLDRPINLNRILVHSPNCRRAGLAMANFIRSGSKLEPRLREIAILVVGYLARVDYEWSHHVKIGKAAGVSHGDIEQLIARVEGRADTLDAEARAVVDAAREMTVDGQVSDATFQLLQRFLDNERLVDLVVTMGHYNGIVRVLRTLQVDVEDDYLSALAEFPLPA